MKTIACSMSAGNEPLAGKAMELLERYLRERRGIQLKPAGRTADLVLEITPGIGAEGFRITESGGRVHIAGNDGRGLIYGAGKYLRDPAWRGTTVPEKPMRAIYFATHFHNFYHDAPVEKIQRYVEELALWGCNTLIVWFDMHHYTGIDDPDAQAMIRRLRAILRAAQDAGMKLGLVGLSNEAFSTSPVALRADWTGGHDGYTGDIGSYRVEICPNKPGGLELILEYRRQMLEAFRDLDVGFFSVGPYDQGGCTCSQCAPWGANGYLKTSEAVSRLVRQLFPAADIAIATWYFDKFTTGEWEGLDRAFATRPDWVDYIVADNAGSFPEYPLKHGMPGKLPALNFPEISMANMWPWGGFGANPRLVHWQEYWNRLKDTFAGGLPYSEGIYEDVNKVLHLQLNWDGSRTTRDIAREYAASEFSPDHADDIVNVMHDLEAAMDHALDHGAALAVLEGGGWELFEGNLPRVYLTPRVTHPGPCAATLRGIDAQLPPAARSSWRWRVLWLRTALDEELFLSKGRPTAKSDAYFDELNRIYHADSADWIVSPISRRRLTGLKHALTPMAALPAIPRNRKYSDFISTWQVSRLMPKTVAAAPAVSLSDPLDWKPVTALKAAHGFVNVHPIFGNDDGIAYFAARVRVRTPGRWILHIGHDGGIRAFVNGRAVLTVPERINPAPVFRSKVRIALDQGVHDLVIALDTSGGLGWGLCAFFETTASARRPSFPALQKTKGD